MSENKQYENEYKVQAVKLAKKIGAVNAANELQIPVNTLYGWIRKAKSGSFDIGCGERSLEESLNIAEENQQLRKRIKALEKENKRLSEMNEFLEDAAAFFAASRQKSGKNKDCCILRSGQMTAEASEKSVFTATRCKSADRHFTIILDVRANHGSISHLLTLC